MASPSNKERSIGAKLINVVKSRDLTCTSGNHGHDISSNMIERNERNNVQDGHVVLKLNGEMVKTRSYCDIVERLERLIKEKKGITLVLERVNDSHPVHKRHVVSHRPTSTVTSPPPSIRHDTRPPDMSAEGNVLKCILKDRNGGKVMNSDVSTTSSSSSSRSSSSNIISNSNMISTSGSTSSSCGTRRNRELFTSPKNFSPAFSYSRSTCTPPSISRPSPLIQDFASLESSPIGLHIASSLSWNNTTIQSEDHVTDAKEEDSCSTTFHSPLSAVLPDNNTNHVMDVKEGDSCSTEFHSPLSAVLPDNYTHHVMDMKGEDNEERKMLSNQIKALESTIVEMENYMVEQNKVSSRNIQALQKLKDEAEEDISHLRRLVITTSDEAQEVSIRLKHCEADVCRLRNELEKEREEKLQIMKRGDVIQNELRGQIKSLTMQLQKYEEESRQNLKERDRPQFKEVLKEFAAAEACANSLAKALVESETELSDLLEANKNLLYNYATLKEEKNTLEIQLQKEIDTRTHEPKSISIHTSRSNALKAAGGRAALNAKLKKTRGNALKSDSQMRKGKRHALGSINENRMASRGVTNAPLVL